MSRHRRPLLLTAAACGVLVAGSVATATTGLAAPAAPSAVRQLNLVADVAGAASVVDPNLVNPWGLSASPTGPLWVSDNGTDVSTVYSGAVPPSTTVSVIPLVVAIPGGGAPTGQVFNSTTEFRLPSGPAAFVFAGENGAITAWNGGSAATVVASSSGAVYKGLALDPRPSGAWLLAADFHNGRVDVYDGSFHRLAAGSRFPATGIPSGYAPFNVAVLGGDVYVTYAKQDAARHDDVPGAGHGLVDVYTPAGRFVRQLAGRPSLNSPWGLAIAPRGFGTLAGDLLVGNFGDGRIHAYDPATGALLATLQRPNGNPVVIDGLWGLLPGNGTAGGRNELWFSAGPGGEAHGLLGLLRA